MPSTLRLARLAALTLALAPVSISAASGAQTTVAIKSCETFRDWFAQQPGSKIFLLGPQNPDAGVRPAAVDTILNYRWDTIKPYDPAFKQMKYYRTNFGGGGCMGGYYDAATRTALILLVYDTATDLVITQTTSIPGGLPTHPVPTGTKRGAKLGMSIAQVQKIEGRGTTYGKNGMTVLFYNQNDKDSYGGTLYGHLGFIFINGKAAAIGVGGGH
jgi:hypothetical protein